jgi:tRNA(Ile)-lysidine synthase
MSSKATLRLDTAQLRPGMRLALGVSGGADSVGLLRALAERAGEFGLVLHVAHLHHGLRGAEADADLEFVRELAARLDLPFHCKRIDTAKQAAGLPGKSAETIEEAARRLRYGWFRELMSSGTVDAVATAHTLDDQAETVLAKVLRGAWTEGMAGIHPVVEFAEGRIVRPMLSVRRPEVEAYLKVLGQEWREDSSNRHLTFTRNRIRHELLPVLEGWNPKLREHLAQMAELARAEETWWQREVARVAREVILPGRPVRGGGRVAWEGVALDLKQLAEHDVALQRRIVRYAAERLAVAVDFAGTEALRKLAFAGRPGQKCELAAGLRAERSHRELRLSIQSGAAEEQGVQRHAQMEVPVPGEAEGLGLRVKIEAPGHQTFAVSPRLAVLRSWKAGDRVVLRHSSGPRKVKEVLERMKVSGVERAHWPVLELNGRIVWMQGVAVEGEPGIQVDVVPIEESGGTTK